MIFPVLSLSFPPRLSSLDFSFIWKEKRIHKNPRNFGLRLWKSFMEIVMVVETRYSFLLIGKHLLIFECLIIIYASEKNKELKWE